MVIIDLGKSKVLIWSMRIDLTIQNTIILNIK